MMTDNECIRENEMENFSYEAIVKMLMWDIKNEKEFFYDVYHPMGVFF